MSFAKNIGKTLSEKYSQKLRDPAKLSAIDAFKTSLKRVIQKIEEATGDLIGSKISYKITKNLKNVATF